MCGQALSLRMSGQPRVTEVGSCVFSYEVFSWKHNNIHQWLFFHMELYLSWWLLDYHKQKSWFAWTLIELVEIIFGWEEPIAFNLLDCDFNQDSKFLIQVSWVTIRRKNAWSSTSNISFRKVVMPRRFCFYWAIKQWGTHLAEFFLFFKSLGKIRNTDVAGTPVALESCSHVARRSF